MQAVDPDLVRAFELVHQCRSTFLDGVQSVVQRDGCNYVLLLRDGSADVNTPRTMKVLLQRIYKVDRTNTLRYCLK